MNNTAEIVKETAKAQYFQRKAQECQDRIDELTLLNDDYILRQDFDGDGVVSIIDLKILADAIQFKNHSPLYNSQDKTYNGKSLNINDDSSVNITDIMSFVSSTFNWIESNVPIDIKVQLNPYTKTGFNPDSWIESYCNSHNGQYPTLTELRTAYNA